MSYVTIYPKRGSVHNCAYWHCCLPFRILRDLTVSTLARLGQSLHPNTGAGFCGNVADWRALLPLLGAILIWIVAKLGSKRYKAYGNSLCVT